MHSQCVGDNHVAKQPKSSKEVGSIMTFCYITYLLAQLRIYFYHVHSTITYLDIPNSQEDTVVLSKHIHHLNHVPGMLSKRPKKTLTQIIYLYKILKKLYHQIFENK